MSRHQPMSFEEVLENTPETRKREVLRQILGRNNTCQIFLGGGENDRFWYPYRLVPQQKVTDRHRNAAQQLMIDSGVADQTVRNRDIIETALEYQAQFVVPKDYLGDPERTQESINGTPDRERQNFLEYYRESGCNAIVIFPMQPPYDEQYDRDPEFWTSVSHVAVGNIRDKEPSEQLEAARTVRSLVGQHTWVHGFGMGASEEVIKTLQREPRLLDSVDTSTFEQLPRFGTLADETWEQRNFSLPNGTDRFTLNAIVTELMVYMANYQLTDLVADDTTRSSESEQPGCSPGTSLDPSQKTLTDDWESGTEYAEVRKPTDNVDSDANAD